MKNPQPFITTELREEWSKKYKWDISYQDEVAQEIIIADFWLQKMSEQKERLIKEVGDLRKNNIHLGFATGNEHAAYERACQDILRRLQSV